MKVQFRTKIFERQSVETLDYNPAFRVPEIKNSHCDMDEFRASKVFGGVANSNMFLLALNRQLSRMGVYGTMDIDQIPACVSVDTSGFLALVTIDVPDEKLW